MAFDPDEYLADSGGFDPDEYLTGTSKKKMGEITVGPYYGIPGMGGPYGFDQQKHEQDKAAFEERLSALPEGQAEIIRGMSPAERTLANIGAGFTDVWYAIPGMGDNPNLDLSNTLEQATDGGLARAVGQAAPFAPLGLASTGLKAGGATLIPEAGGLGGAALRQAVVGGLEGGAIAEGTGSDALGVATGAALGSVLAGGAEVLAPIVRRYGGALIRKVFGEAPTMPPIDENLVPSPELKAAMDKEGLNIEDLVKESGAEQMAKEVAGASTSGAQGRVDELAAGITTNPSRVAAAERMGVDAPLAALTDQPPVHQIVGAASAVPGSKTSESLIRFNKDLTKKADDMMEEFSGFSDKEVVSEKLKGSMQETISELKTSSDELYSQIRERVPESTIVNAKPLLAELNRRGGKSSKGVAGLSDVEQDVYKKLSGKPTYFDIDNLRKDIGASLGRVEGSYTNQQKATLNDMYSKLTQLQEGVANQIGDDAGELWKQAKKADVARFEMQDNSEFLFGKNNVGTVMPKLERSMQMLAKGDNKAFKEIVGAIPEKQKGATISAAIDSIIRKSYAGDVRLDANGYAKWYNQLSRSPTNKSTLMKELPEGAPERLEDLYLMAQGLANVTNNQTKTGVVNSVFKKFDDADGLVARLYGVADKISQAPIVGAAVGAPTRILAGTAKMATKERTPAIQAADELLASPEFRSTVLSLDLPQKRQQLAIKKLEQTKEYKNYLNSQNKTRAASIASMGLIPFLTSESEE